MISPKATKFYLLLISGLLLSLPTFSQSGKGGKRTPVSPWIKLNSEKGITVWKRNNENSNIVSFKGEVIINASIHEVFSVLFDPYHKKDFIQNCVEFDILQFKNLPNSTTSYIRLGNNIPFIDDRDIVLKSQVQFFPKNGSIKVYFKKAPNDLNLKPKRKNIVRIPKLEGLWTLKSSPHFSLKRNIDKKVLKTKITYQVTSHPGGIIPTWLVNLANRDLPFKTLQKMRLLIGQKEKFARTRKVVKYLFDFSPFFTPSHPSVKRNHREKSEVKASLITEFKKACAQGKEEACKIINPFTLL